LQKRFTEQSRDVLARERLEAKNQTIASTG